MRAFVFIFTSLAVLGAASLSSAQVGNDSVAMSSAALYDSCVANNQGSTAECACMAGFYGGRLDEPEYRLLSVLNPYIGPTGDIADMAAAQRALQAEAARMGLSQARYQQAMQRFTLMNDDGAYGDRVCVALRGR